MKETMKKTEMAIFINDVRSICFKPIEVGEVKPNQVRIKTLFSGISQGTELNEYRGDSPFYRKVNFHRKMRLFSQVIAKRREYPIQTGYENVGEVVEVGKDVSDLKVGDVIFTYRPHQTGLIVDGEAAYKLPKGLSPEIGVFAALTGVAYNAILDARIVLGETVAIFGMGVVGLILTQLAKMSGAKKVIAVDLIEKRLEHAKKIGADIALNPVKTEDLALEVRKITENRGADVVIECSGSPKALHEAIRTVCFQGSVVIVSYYGAKEGQGLFLGEEFHHNRIKIVSSQAAGVNPELSPRWSIKRKTRAALGLLPSLKLKEMVTHIFCFEDAPKAYELVDEDSEKVIQVILRY